MEIKNLREKLWSYLWFSLSDMKVTLKQLPKEVSKKSFLKKASDTKLYSGTCGPFVKQREIGLFYLTAESRILQFCFCQQPY